ncbi:MAG: hypothetical protein AB8B72_07690 [Crocinitomicaceae bacterium]
MENKTDIEIISKEEIEMLRDTVTLIDGNVVYHKVISKTTVLQEKIMFEEIGRVTKHLTKFFYINDLSDAVAPSPEVKKAVQENIQGLEEKIAHLFIITGKNKLLNLMLNFILKPILGNISFSLHNSYDSAKDALQEKKLQHSKKD